MLKTWQAASTTHNPADRFFRSVRSAQIPQHDVEPSNTPLKNPKLKEYYMGKWHPEDSFSLESRNSGQTIGINLEKMQTERITGLSEYSIQEYMLNTHKDPI